VKVFLDDDRNKGHHAIVITLCMFDQEEEKNMQALIPSSRLLHKREGEIIIRMHTRYAVHSQHLVDGVLNSPSVRSLTSSTAWPMRSMLRFHQRKGSRELRSGRWSRGTCNESTTNPTAGLGTVKYSQEVNSKHERER
jgi:hypothetical protein